VTIAAIHPDIFKAYVAYEASFGSASRVSAASKELALLKVAAIVGCPFCVDLGGGEEGGDHRETDEKPKASAGFHQVVFG
jgi:alkylhydroperoxidase family enzyme